MRAVTPEAGAEPFFEATTPKAEVKSATDPPTTPLPEVGAGEGGATVPHVIHHLETPVEVRSLLCTYPVLPRSRGE